LKKIYGFAVVFALSIIMLQLLSNQAITTHAQDPTYSLTVSRVGCGFVVRNPDASSYAPGTNVSLTAVPNAGWEFSGWSGDLGGSDSSEYLPMDNNKTVTAIFTEITEYSLPENIVVSEILQATTEYSLSVNIIGSGSVSVNGSSPYPAGSVVQLTATPAAGWMFSGWSGDLPGSANPEFLLMDSNKSVTATFTEIPEPPEYSLSVNIIGSGIVTVNGSSPYIAGSVVVMTAYPSDGWTFAGWSGDVTGMANPELLLMNSNKSVTVTFTKIPAIIESCDMAGAKKDTFMVGDDVYANGTGYQPRATYDIYVVEDVTWVDGMAIPPRVPGTTTTVTTDTNGNIPPTLLWSSPLTPGKYDILVDVDGDGLYYAEADALDDNDIEVTAGFFVIPEVPLGTIMVTLGMFGALLGFVKVKRSLPKIRLK